MAWYLSSPEYMFLGLRLVYFKSEVCHTQNTLRDLCILVIFIYAVAAGNAFTVLS